MKNKIDKGAFNRFLDGNHTSSDYNQVKVWFEEKEASTPLDEFIHKNWLDFKVHEPKKDLSFILHRIQAHIYKNEKKQKKSLWYYYRQIAAVMIFPILLYTAYLFANTNKISVTEAQHTASWAEIYSPPGARTKFMLPDGTSGWLNGGSSIKYPVGFNKRNVKVNGEAFFDVTHKGKDQFTVQTYAVDVVVMGTKFNVAAYSEDNFVEIVLEQGKVKLDGRNKSFSEELSPNERFILYSDQKQGAISNVDASIYSSWKEGKLVFRDEAFSNVLKRLGRWYNVHFEIKDKQLNSYVYQATFKDETLEEALRVLAFTVPMYYEIQSRKLNVDGTYSKREVIIWGKNK